MKSVLSKKGCEEESPYPKLMVGGRNGTVVLMVRPNTGTCVHSGASSHTVGHYSGTWGSNFKDYDGDVCLTN